MKLRPIDLTLAGMFITLMAIGANITSIAPFMMVGSVPITLQTFFAILAGVILGSRLGAISMVGYTLAGLVGIPVFAKFGAGFSTIFSSNFGFIISFIFTAYIAGKIVERFKSAGAYITASLIGMAVNYLFGTNWMYMAFKLWAAAPPAFSYKVAWLWMMAPLPKDIILAVCAGLMGHRLERTVLSKGQFKYLKRAS
ncbi:biotin transport system substrate-specific component [Peribacillus deserti]|uniref:Biotin transporter n=1 Tax=Peribacillus deserti TaxID=673318 RepID=A0ABS2QIH7_9BACI|nr:biotin transporter BioY [Peribacillus deserti]MBM7692957.1 biotin transport system substrate-specific component [Peribacillus deserti]